MADIDRYLHNRDWRRLGASPGSPRLTALAGILLSTLLAALLQVPPAGATDNGSFAIAPFALSGGGGRSAFVVEAAPGQTISDRLSVFNYTDKPITFSIFGADAYNTAQGALALRLPDPETGALPVGEDVGAWLAVPVTTLVAQPQTRSDIPFTLTVPADAEPGDHTGGIVALDTTPVPGQGDEVKVDVQQALGVRVYVRVDGDVRPDLTASDISVMSAGAGLAAPIAGPEGAQATFLINNTGNVRLTPKATVRVTDMFGREVASGSVDGLPELLPGESLEQTVELGDLSGFGPRYRVSVTTEAEGVRSTTSTSLWVVPWLLLLAIAVLLAACILVIRRRRAERTAEGGGSGGPGGPSAPSPDAEPPLVGAAAGSPPGSSEH